MLLRNIRFIIIVVILTSSLRVYAQEDPAILISCPSWGGENRLPSSLSDMLLFTGDRSDGSRGLSLFVVDNIGISEIHLPASEVHSILHYSLSTLGNHVAYFEIQASDSNVPDSLTVFNIAEETATRFEIEDDIASYYEISWIDDSHVALTPEVIVTGNEQLKIINVDTSKTESQPVSLPPDIALPFIVDYSPHLNLFAFLGSDRLGIASSNGEILFSSQTFDYYNPISSIAWGDNQDEVLLYTDNWYIFSVETQELIDIDAPTAYRFFRTGVWSPDGMFIAFTGFRLPEDRPNILFELIVYDRASNSFTDFCQIGDFLIYGEPRGMRWSLDSRNFAYILTDNRGLGLYVIDIRQSTVTNIDLDKAGGFPGILGWRSKDLLPGQ